MFLKIVKKSFIVTKIKNIIYAIIYEIYDVVTWLVILNKRPENANKKLLIVRVDEIGDYMLWHNFLKEIVEKFDDYSIDFCGNSACKSIFNAFDEQGIDNAIWLDKQLFTSSLVYRYKFLKNIYLQHYDVVINARYARERISDDTIVKAASAKQAFGMDGKVKIDNERHNSKLYTHMLNFNKKSLFEFYKNQLFTEFVTNTPSKVKSTLISFENLPVNLQALPTNYFVVFTGARSPEKIWPTANFIDVANYIYKITGGTAVVCGGPGDVAYASPFITGYKNPCIDLTAKTSLTEMLTILKTARCLISVDTGSVHLAAAVGCAVFGIFNGSHFKRFAPYPKEIAEDFFAIYPDEIENDCANEEVVENKYQHVIDIPYSNVTAEKVIEQINFNKHVLN